MIWSELQEAMEDIHAKKRSLMLVPYLIIFVLCSYILDSDLLSSVINLGTVVSTLGLCFLIDAAFQVRKNREMRKQEAELQKLVLEARAKIQEIRENRTLYSSDNSGGPE